MNTIILNPISSWTGLHIISIFILMGIFTLLFYAFSRLCRVSNRTFRVSCITYILSMMYISIGLPFYLHENFFTEQHKETNWKTSTGETIKTTYGTYWKSDLAKLEGASQIETL